MENCFRALGRSLRNEGGTDVKNVFIHQKKKKRRPQASGRGLNRLFKSTRRASSFFVLGRLFAFLRGATQPVPTQPPHDPIDGGDGHGFGGIDRWGLGAGPAKNKKKVRDRIFYTTQHSSSSSSLLG